MRARWMFLVLLAVPGMLSAARTARLAEPNGTITETSPTFTWSAVDTATRYDLWVVGRDGPKITKSITPGDGCDATGACSFQTTEPLAPGPYLWLVLSRIPGNVDRWSIPRKFTVSPDGARPGKVQLVAPSGEVDTTTPTFTWMPAGANADYELIVRGSRPRTYFREVYSGASICDVDLCTAPPSITNLTLGDGKYDWSVRASNVVGRGARSDKMRFNVQTLPQPPARVALIAPRGRMSQTSPLFVWNKAERASEYYLEIRSSHGTVIHGEWYPADATLCPDTTCSIAPSGLVVDYGRYRFRVTGKNVAGRGRPSRSMSFRIGDYLDKPVAIAPSGMAGLSPAFQWTPVSDATHYIVRVRQGRARIATTRVEAASSCDTALCSVELGMTLSEGAYRWSVIARSDVRRSSSPSDWLVFEAKAGGGAPPETPVSLAPADTVKVKTPEFRWSHVATATQYKLTVKDSKDPVLYAHIYSVDEASCDQIEGCKITPTEMLETGDYSFIVEAINGAGSSPPSAPKVFKVDLGGGGAPPGVPTILAPSGTVIESTPVFSWNPVTSATKYVLTVKNAADPVVYTHEYGIDVCGVICEVTPADILADGTYTFFVTAKIGDVSGNPGEGKFTVDTNDAPPASTPLSPSGQISETNPTFSWSVVSEAVAYTLVVVDEGGPTEIHRVRYELGNLTCDATQCSLTPNPALDLRDARYSFSVITENAGAKTTPSASLAFNVSTGVPATTPLSPTGQTAETNPTFVWSFVAEAVAYTLVIVDEGGPTEIHRLRYELAELTCDTTQCAVTPSPVLDLADGTYSFTVVTEDAATRTATSSSLPFTVSTGIPSATPLSPAGQITERNPLFMWTFVDEAVAYTLVVVDEGVPTELHRVRYELADLTCDTTQCSVTPSPALDLPDGTYSFTVISEDAATTTTTSAPLAFNVSTAPATVRVTSHSDGDTLAATGLVISGTVDAGTVSLTAQLDIDGSPIMAARPVEISPNDAWTVFLLPGQLSPGAAVLTLVGTDASNNSSTLVFNFTIAAFDLKESMLLTRATFGATPALLDELRSGGVTAFQDRLLNPVPDPGFDAFVASLPTSSKSEVREYALMHAIFNPNPLQEVMTQFWDNHFSTDMDSHDVAEFELRENNTFRAQAFGRFRSLLEASAKSPAMLIYLDATNNVVGDPNENYSREILELSTLGVNGGYTQRDIENLARILTGWKENGGNFEFVGSDHDFGTKTFLGVSFPTGAGAGLAEGEVVLDMLSAHRSTAEYLCTKLAQVFISEDPRAGLVAGCADVFQAEHQNGNPNQMRDVVQFLLDSPDFVDPVNFHSKVKTPLEYLASTVRHLDATVEDRRDLERDLDNDLDMELFGHSSPDGFSETADDWIDTSLLLARVNFVNEVARETSTNDTYVDIRAYFQDKGFETAEGVVGYLFDIALQNEFTDLELGIAYDILSGRGTSQFDINGVDAEPRLRQLVATVFSFPGFQHQ